MDYGALACHYIEMTNEAGGTRGHVRGLAGVGHVDRCVGAGEQKGKEHGGQCASKEAVWGAVWGAWHA